MEGAGDSSIANNDRFIQKLHDFLHRDEWYKPILEKLEHRTSVKREYLVLGLAVAFTVNLVLGFGGELICNAVGVVYPALETIRVIEERKAEESVKWLKYWIVFSVFNFLELLTCFIVYLIPFFWLLKCMFLFWCFAPVKNNGCIVLYHLCVYPLVKSLKEKAEAAAAAGENMYLENEQSDSDASMLSNSESTRKLRPRKRATD